MVGISKAPLLKRMTEVLLMQVPSGKIMIGSFLGLEETWVFMRLDVWWRSLVSERSNQMLVGGRGEGKILDSKF